MTKNLTAQEQPIAKIFNSDYLFNIPGYQRPYAWTREQAQDLFDDLTNFLNTHSGPIEEMAPYFLGSIVLIKEPNSPEAQVVDGQQRLTTLTILLSAIRSLVAPESGKFIAELLFQKGNPILQTKDCYRITLRERDEEFFRRYVQREEGFNELIELKDTLSDSQNRIRENAILFNDLLNGLSEDEKVSLATFIAIRCYLVVVATPDFDSAYRIFSVLNSRGLNLSPTDILKAEAIGGISDQLRESYRKKWEDIEEELGRDGFNDLFSHIRMIYRKAKPQGTILNEFKAHVTEFKQPKRFMDEVLIPLGKAYREMIDSDFELTDHSEQIGSFLTWINRLEFRDWIPPALAFVKRHRNNPELLVSFFKDLERLVYWMLVTKVGVNGRIERFSRLTKDIEAESDLQGVRSALQLSPHEQYEFYDTLQGPIYSVLSSRARTAVILRLDSLVSGGGASYQYEIVSVEHVLPQTIYDGSQWAEWFPDFVTQDEWQNRLGNLVLLTRRKNSAASNYDFETKKKKYFTQKGVSPFALTSQVLSESAWTVDVVEKRQKDLLGILERHWRLEERQNRYSR